MVKLFLFICLLSLPLLVAAKKGESEDTSTEHHYIQDFGSPLGERCSQLFGPLEGTSYTNVVKLEDPHSSVSERAHHTILKSCSARISTDIGNADDYVGLGDDKENDYYKIYQKIQNGKADSEYTKSVIAIRRESTVAQRCFELMDRAFGQAGKLGVDQQACGAFYWVQSSENTSKKRDARRLGASGPAVGTVPLECKAYPESLTEHVNGCHKLMWVLTASSISDMMTAAGSQAGAMITGAKNMEMIQQAEAGDYGVHFDAQENTVKTKQNVAKGQLSAASTKAGLVTALLASRVTPRKLRGKCLEKTGNQGFCYSITDNQMVRYALFPNEEGLVSAATASLTEAAGAATAAGIAVNGYKKQLEMISSAREKLAATTIDDTNQNFQLTFCQYNPQAPECQANTQTYDFGSTDVNFDTGGYQTVSADPSSGSTGNGDDFVAMSDELPPLLGGSADESSGSAARYNPGGENNGQGAGGAGGGGLGGGSAPNPSSQGVADNSPAVKELDITKGKALNTIGGRNGRRYVSGNSKTERDTDNAFDSMFKKELSKASRGLASLDFAAQLKGAKTLFARISSQYTQSRARLHQYEEIN